MVLRVGDIGSPFSNKAEFFETKYDFDEDTGAQGTYVMTAGAEEACMIRLVGIKVNAALVGATATLTVQTSTTADAFLNSEPVASFTLGAVVIPENATTGGTAGFVKIAADDTLDFVIDAVADLTAGELTFVWEVMRF